MATPPGGRDPQDGPDYSDIKKRLDQLGGKIDRVQDRERANAPQDNAARGKAMSFAFRMATELVAGVFVGALFGYGLDSLLGTAPILLIVFLLLGVAAALFNSVRAAQNMQKDL
jgi:ATP synthase protein I